MLLLLEKEDAGVLQGKTKQAGFRWKPACLFKMRVALVS
jgi:hypothetical protein